MKLPLPKPLRSLLTRMGARSRIAAGQVFLLAGVLMLAITLRLVPSQQQTILEDRAKFCEAVAVHCSTCVARGEEDTLRASFVPMVARDPNVLSAAIVTNNGSQVAVYGQHPTNWQIKTAKSGDDAHIVVPIWQNDQRWGEVQMRFRPAGASGMLGGLFNGRLGKWFTPQVQLVAFVVCLCAALFVIYLRKMLQHLDPSKVVPPRVRAALDTLAEGLLVLDNEQRIVLANQAFAALAGRTTDELMGSGISRLPWVVQKADAKNNQPAEYPWDQVSRDGKQRRGDVLRLPDTTGAMRTFSVNCSPILGDEARDGVAGRAAARGVLVSLDDVTVLEQKEQELRLSRDAAERANAAKSEFLARMSHEIRTPMNAILGFADVLRRGYETSEQERAEYLQTIHSSGQHLLELINDVLDLSKIEAGKLEIELSRCSPHKLISEVAAVLAVRAKQKGIGLEFTWDSQAPESIETDPTRLRQVITNLVGNAIKFTDQGGVAIRAKLLTSGSALEIRISDTGIGMKPDALERIFKPFSQADSSITRRFGGTGLGLSISKQIVEALGGSVRVESHYGKGSTFIVTIATGAMNGIRLLSADQIERAAATQAAAQASPQLALPPCRVLLVEDGVSNRKLITLVLQRAGAALIDEAEDGKSGAERALAGNYDVVLMDMQMPIMDGYTAASLLRSKGYKKPIIALTAHAMRGDEEKCRSAGCSGFLTKPIDMDLLVRTLSEAVGDSANAGGANPVIAKPAAPKAASVKPAAQPAVAPKAVAAKPSLEPLRSTLPTDDPEFAEIVNEFVDRLQQQVGAIQQAHGRQELDELARLAHWVKGSGGTAGFAALTEPARNLELAAKNGKLDAIAGAIGSLRSIVDRIHQGSTPLKIPAKSTESPAKA